MNRARSSLQTQLAAALVAVALASGGAPLAAQVPDVFTNLQVLSKEITKAELVAGMRTVASDLGVRCHYCHDGPEDLQGMDFAADTKPTKVAAREMFRMVKEINTKILPSLPDSEEPRRLVSCYTCHRGAPRPPRPLMDEILEIALSEGADRAIAHYEELRREHGPDGQYDLGPRSLGRAARRLAARGEGELARSLARFTAETHADSAAAHTTLGSVLLDLGEPRAAAESFRRALVLDPEHPGAKWGLGRAERSLAKTWSFQAADGVELFAEYRQPSVEPSPLIVLLHQAGGDGRGEYAPIIPRLLELGYSTLAVDLRSGGEHFGETNRTVAAQEGKEWSYCDAEPDVEAALDEVRRRRAGERGLALWGSSYSATLAVRVGARRSDEVAAILAFSPAAGGPMEGCSAEELWTGLPTPAIVFRPERELEYPPVAEQWARVVAAGVPAVAAPGSHGSSLLVEERGSSGAEAAWRAVESFLAAHLPQP